MSNVDVYIACSGVSGRKKAAEIADRLRNQHVSSRIGGLDNDRAEDLSAQSRCRVFLFLCNGESARDRRLLESVEKVGKRRDVTVMVFRLDDRALSDSAMFYLSKHHWIDGTAGDPMERMEELVEEVAQAAVERWPGSVQTGVGTGDKGPFVFISYSRRNKDRLLALCQILRAYGIRYWYDEGIAVGRKWDNVVADRICAARCFLALVSHEYLRSDICQDELLYARGRNKPIGLIKLDTAELTGEVDMRCGRIQRIPGWDLNFPETLMKKLMTLDGFRSCGK